jgi:hypothetical protein
MTGFILCFLLNALSGPVVTRKYIMVDQFGYRPNDKKIAVIVDPIAGFNAADEFIPGKVYEIRKWETDEVVFTGSPMPYNGLKIFEPSGDRGWWFDFSQVNRPGDYYVFDLEKQVGSYRFTIDNYVYGEVLKAAMRMYYYQRVNAAKELPYAEVDWTDGAAFMGDNQDADCHALWARTDENLVRDLSGGWMDAGDVNKYVTFAESVIHQLLLAYEMKPQAFTDDYDIPESGNGIPDIIDEVKYEIDWLKKMQDTADGGVFIKMGEIDYNGKSPLSDDKRPRYYGPKCSSSSIAAAGMFSHAGIVFSKFPELGDYAADLLIRAEEAYNWYEDNPKSDHCDSQEIKAGDADRSLNEQQQMKVVAAIYLFALTRDETYNTVVKEGYNTLQPYLEPFWSLKYATHGDALMYYTQIPGADATVVQNILTKRTNEGRTSEFYFNNNDLYNGYMPAWAYWWGSNGNKANVGIMNYDYLRYGIDPANHNRYKDHALGILHYYHGINPFNLVFLTNMVHHGAEKSCDEIYHTWFKDGTEWDNAVTGAGPAPGYLPGGVNIYDKPDVPVKLGNTVYDARVPDQPQLKMYSEVNHGDRPWTITEPAIYYQAAYVYLLSSFAVPDCDTSIHVQGISLAGDTITLLRGFEGYMAASLIPEGICNNFVDYFVSDTNIAWVDDQGKITARAAGVAILVAFSNENPAFSDSCVIEVLPCTRVPYSGEAIVIPGKVEAEEYDIGCNDAYHDSDAINSGGQFREDGADIEPCSEGGFNIGWINAGEWTEYTLRIETAGTFSIMARVASEQNRGSFVVSLNGNEWNSDTFRVSLSHSSGWQNWQNIVVNGLELAEGEHTMRITMTSDGFNLNHLEFLEGEVYAPKQPTNLTAVTSGSSIVLGWDDNALDETGYVIERKTTGSFKAIDTVDAGTESHTDAAVNTGKLYTYRIYCFNELLDSENSNEAAGMLSAIESSLKAIPAMYPNPSTGAVTISFDEVAEGSLVISIYEITGKKVFETRDTPDGAKNDIHLNLELNPGLYLIKIKRGEEWYIGKLRIETVRL